MKIELEIPDHIWVSIKDQRLDLIAGGRQLIATTDPWDKVWRVKTVRCNFCGECCMDIAKESWSQGIDDEGKCAKLIKDGLRWVCSAGYDTPIRCIPDPLLVNTPTCCIKYEEQPK